jgi:hypothetical protein
VGFCASRKADLMKVTPVGLQKSQIDIIYANLAEENHL